MSYETREKTYQGITVTQDAYGYMLENPDGGYTVIGSDWQEAKEYLDTNTLDENGYWPISLTAILL